MCTDSNLYTEEEDVCLSCPYFNPEAPDCCTYSPEDCYYNEYNEF